jgi:hypothetical protein
MAEAMRMIVMQKNPAAMLFRGIVGIRGRTLIVNSYRYHTTHTGYLLPELTCHHEQRFRELIHNCCQVSHENDRDAEKSGGHAFSWNRGDTRTYIDC